ncbi:MAG: hypothetical protein Q4A13_03080, partial [Fretibacterium sp.]|nr:hypothetical protein [Fretibacterium sp.]
MSNLLYASKCGTAATKNPLFRTRSRSFRSASFSLYLMERALERGREEIERFFRVGPPFGNLFLAPGADRVTIADVARKTFNFIALREETEDEADGSRPYRN